MRAEAELALLRRFEPIIRYTRGEKFFPMNVETYVRACSLWVQRPDQPPVCLVPKGKLTLDELAEPRSDRFEAVYFLKFIEPLNITELAAYRLQQGLTKKDAKDIFYAGPGRLARVGYVSRFIDALFSVSLLTRGRVPGDTAAAAALAYQRLLAEQEEYRYYGRVIRQNGWVALQYWFFYPFNDWRSGFYGVNDHEADWEMIYIYLYEQNGELRPEWVAYAAHDFYGDDLRRRWDDPEVEKEGEHPVIYAGAGSHASYYAPGEYLSQVELPFLSPLVRLVDKQRKLRRKLLRQYQGEPDQATMQNGFNIFRIPFVDYARGDGLSLGPGQDKTWADPHLLDPVPTWALHYRGLWGLYARDPIAGEDAPAGPVYNRNGAMRRSWYDPLGWAGLDKQPPPDQALSYTLERWLEIEARQNNLLAAVEEKSRELTGLGIEVAAMQGHPHLKELHAAHQDRIATLSEELNQIRAQLASDQALLEALSLYSAQIQAGQRGPARAHIYRAHHPASAARLRLNRFAEAWAATSIGLTMIAFVILILFARHYLFFGLVTLVSLMIFIEAGFRRQLQRLITSVTAGLALVAGLIIFYDFFWQIIVLAVLLTGGYIMWENLRELWA